MLKVLSDPDLNLLDRWLKIRILTVCGVGGFGLIGQAIFLLVITAIRTPQSAYLTLGIFIGIELVPALLLLFISEVTPAQKNLITTIQSKTSGSGGSKESKSSRTPNLPTSSA